MSSKENKFLVVGPNVVTNELIERVLVALEPHFAEANHKAIATSGVRTAEDQLRIIRYYLKQKRLSEKYKEAMFGMAENKLANGQYAWQMGWSALLNAGVIINPPLKATLLMDYVVGGVNKKGKEYNQTMHANGLCLDIGGEKNGLADEVAIVKEAMKEIPEIISYIVEHNNNCLHLNLKKV